MVFIDRDLLVLGYSSKQDGFLSFLHPLAHGWWFFLARRSVLSLKPTGLGDFGTGFGGPASPPFTQMLPRGCWLLPTSTLGFID